MADTAAALVIQLSADFRDFQRQMKSATGAFDAEGRKIERRQAQLKKNLQNGFSGIGKYLIGGAALYGVERFVDSIVEAGGKIKDASDATRVGTDELQAWGLLAERAGTSQDAFNGALEKFSKNLGNASIQGGDAAKFYKQLGIDVKGNTTDAFYQLADAVSKVQNPQQRVALVTQALGKSAASLTPILAQGSTALRAQTAELVKSGQVIKSDAIDKIDDLGDAWNDFKRQIIATGGNALAEPLSNFTEVLKDPQVQSSLKTFATSLSEVAGYMARIAKYAPELAGAYGAFKLSKTVASFVPNPVAKAAIIGGGTALGAAIGYFTTTGTSSAPQASTSGNGPNAKGGNGSDLTDFLGTDAKKLEEGRKELADLAKRDAKETRDATLKANDDIRESNLDVSDSRHDAIKAQDDALLQLTQGTAEYYDIQKKVIQELSRLDISSINDRRDADLAAIKERADAADQEAADELEARKRQLKELVDQDKITPAQADAARASFEAQQSEQRTQRLAADAADRERIEKNSALQIEAINTKKNADLAQADEDYYQTHANLIKLNDGIRQGLIDIGTAGVHGFGSLKDAAAQVLEQISQMILQMYVLEPLVKKLLGPPGTTGGGLLGNLFSSAGGGGDLFSSLGTLFGFANGGVMTPQGPRQLKRYAGGGTSNVAAIFGEAGPEAAVPLPDGRRIPVDLRVPNIPSGAAQKIIQPVYQFDLRGAVMTQDLLKQMNQIGARAANDGATRGASIALRAQPQRAVSNQLLGT